MVSSNSNVNEEQLILENIRLIHLVIKQMHLKWDTEDEHQSYIDSGMDGLINAAKKYDSESGNKFSTFACVCIRSMISRNLYLKTMPKRFNPNGKDISLNYVIDNENDSREYGDYFPDPNVNIEEEVEKKFEIERLLNAVNSLDNEKDKIALKMYYGLDNYAEHTLEQAGKKMGVTREMIRYRVNRALKQLKEYLKRQDREMFVLNSKPKKAVERKIVMNESKEDKKKNTLLDLNSMLFEQLDKLNSAKEDTEFDKEIRKSYAVSQLAQQIVANTNTCIKALNLAKEQKIDSDKLKFIGINEK